MVIMLCNSVTPLLHIVVNMCCVPMHVCCDPKHMLTKYKHDKHAKHYCSGAGPRQKRKCSSRSRTDGASDIRQDPAHCNAMLSALQQGKLGCKAAASTQNLVTAGQSVLVGGGNIPNEAMGFDRTRAEGGQSVGEAECSQLTIPVCGQQSPCKRMKIEIKQEPQRLI